MVNKALICLFALAIVIGCVAQQKDTAEIPVEEISLTVTGMVWSVCTSKVQDALSKVAGVTEVVSVSQADQKAVVKVEKGKVETATLIDTIAAIEEIDDKPRFVATVIE